jgi:putative ABC transport system permease protein
MTFAELLRDTWRTLMAHKLRTFLTMFGIAWGIISITLMVAAGEGLRVGQQNVAKNFSKDVMIVFSGRTSMQAGGARAGRRIRFRANDYQAAAEQSPSCRYILPELGQNNIPVKSRYNSGSFLVTGSLPPFAEIRSLEPGWGRFYNWEDNAQARRVAFIGSEVHEQLFAGRDAVGETIQVRDFPYTVIGVMAHKDQDSSYDGQDINKVFIPFRSELRDLPNRTGPPDAVDRLLVQAHSPRQHDDCKWELRRALGKIHNFDPRDDEAAGIWDTVESARFFRNMTDSMKYFMGAVGIVTLFLGGIGVMNIMLVAVRERTREIGVRKAVGARRSDITRQFFFETLIVVFGSGGFGLSMAYGFCLLVNAALFSNPQPNSYFAGLLPTLSSGLLAFGVLGAVALLSALYPANRAAAVDPIEALRDEAGG